MARGGGYDVRAGLFIGAAVPSEAFADAFAQALANRAAAIRAQSGLRPPSSWQMSTRQYAATEAAQPEASGELDATEAAVLQAYTAQLDNLHLLAIQYALDTLGAADPAQGVDMNAFLASMDEYLLSLHEFNVDRLKSILAQLLDDSSTESSTQATSSTTYP
ncbi:hypothetical protein COHA_006284 [Chlorella ohadii]|uniref:Uncharacterized protein n=1 Tax=Chlorella ohadii TaxID=2649997 RepID=A0AAD5DP62_9CHLO|nr:hypothetical protein COHA_006284 [Chlorella ohadii]